MNSSEKKKRMHARVHARARAHTHTKRMCVFTSTEQFVMSRSKVRHCYVKTRHPLSNVSDKPMEHREVQLCIKLKIEMQCILVSCCK